MTPEQIEAMAREAGLTFEPKGCTDGAWYIDSGYARNEICNFAALVAAAERERCAKVCGMESVVLATRDQTRGALHCAAAIRALG